MSTQLNHQFFAVEDVPTEGPPVVVESVVPTVVA